MTLIINRKVAHILLCSYFRATFFGAQFKLSKKNFRMSAIKKTIRNTIVNDLQMDVTELANYFDITRAQMSKILNGSRRANETVASQMHKLRMALSASRERNHVAQQLAEIEQSLWQSDLEAKEEWTQRLQARILTRRRELAEMKEAYTIAVQTYNRIDYVLKNISQLTEIQDLMLQTKQRDCVAQMRTTHPIQQKMLEAKIAGLEREVEILSTAGS